MSYIDTIQGQRFGKLVVIGIVNVNKRREAKCRCDCGNEKIVSARMLKRGDSTSCGCYHRAQLSERRRADLIGRRFNRLEVVSLGGGKLVGNQGAYNYTWVCKCDCGSNIEVTSNSLLSGNTQSCGCYNRDRASVTQIKRSSLVSRVNAFRSIARARGKGWSLGEKEAAELIAKNCAYCNTPPNKSHGLTGLMYHGIDRIDSSKPYELGNVVPCCKNCNFAKNDLSATEFKSHIERMYHHFCKGNQSHG